MIKSLFSKLAQHPAFNWVNLAWSILNFGAISLMAFGWNRTKELFSVTGTMGDTLGPIVGILGAVFVYRAYMDQRKTNDFNTSTVFANLLMEELNRIKEEISHVEFKGNKGKDSVTSFLNEMIVTDSKRNGYGESRKSVDIWEIDFDEYLYSILFILSKINTEYDNIINLKIDERLKNTLLSKVKELIYRFLSTYNEVLDKLSENLQDAMVVANNHGEGNYSNFLKVYPINTLIEIQSKYEEHLNRFVDDGFLILSERNQSISNIFEIKVEIEKFNKLNLTKVYRLPNNTPN